MTVRRKTTQSVTVGLLSLVAIVHVLPLVATLLNSFRTDRQIKQFPVGLPTAFNLDNYVKAWNVGGYSRAFANSLVVSVGTTLVVVMIAILSGYFLARTRARIKGPLLVYFGVALSIPVFSFLIPVYFTFSELSLVNTRHGLILIFIAINMPFNILLARTFVMGIPKELDESAMIDGCTTYQVIGRIIVPVAKPIITTIALIVFVTTWNEFTVANTFLQSPELKTASTRYVLFVGERGADLSLVYTAGVVTMLPIVVVFLALQNYFIEGMTSGSIK